MNEISLWMKWMKLALTKSQSELKSPTTCSISKWTGSLLSLCGGRTQPSPISEVVTSRVKQSIANSSPVEDCPNGRRLWAVRPFCCPLSCYMKWRPDARDGRRRRGKRSGCYRWLCWATAGWTGGALHWEETAGWHALRRSSNKRNISARPEASKSANRRSRVS